MNGQPDLQPRIGLFGIGLETYWPQFDGLLQRLSGRQRIIAERLQSMGAELIDVGMVDNPDKARQAASRFRREQVDLIFLYISTYALSSTVLPVVQEARSPLVVLSLQSAAQLDYEAFNRLGDRGVMTGVWLEHCQSCSAPEIACVFNRAGIPYHLVTGYLQDEDAWNEIADWVDAAQRGGGHARKPRRRARTLLLRNARRLQRPHPAVGRLRQSLRVARNVPIADVARGCPG